MNPNELLVQLQDLDGHTGHLTGVWYQTVTYPDDRWRDDGQGMGFILDGETYLVSEDPDDGYRSSMESLKRGVQIPEGAIVSMFEPVELEFRYTDPYTKEYGYLKGSDMVVARDSKGRERLAFGTDNVGDYYPCFVAEYLAVPPE